LIWKDLVREYENPASSAGNIELADEEIIRKDATWAILTCNYIFNIF
jgi:hypothetical protein